MTAPTKPPPQFSSTVVVAVSAAVEGAIGAEKQGFVTLTVAHTTQLIGHRETEKEEAPLTPAL